MRKALCALVSAASAVTAAGCFSNVQITDNHAPPASQAFTLLASPNQLDLLFVVDDAGGAAAQAKLAAQVPTFLQTLQQLPRGLPDLHVAVITTDMGAASNTATTCSSTGDDGRFQTVARGTCPQSPLPNGATYLAQSDTSRNFTGDLASAVQCLLPVGSSGCGFIQPLAAVTRALGADSFPAVPPTGNAGFLRPGARLAIILLTAHDDCSAPAGSPLFSLQTDHSSLAEPLGPLNAYRCNHYGHLCDSPDGLVTTPPLTPPAGGGPLSLTDCSANGSVDQKVMLRVDDAIRRIRSLKADPDDQIAVAAIVAPAAPYAVDWLPAGAANPQNPDELWPRVMHSCGAAGGDGVNRSATQTTNDGTFGDPAVRITQFANGFVNRTIGSICDASYAGAMTSIAGTFRNVASHCLDALVTHDATRQPLCNVTRNAVAADGGLQWATLRNCGPDAGLSPCWSAHSDDLGCGPGASALAIRDDTVDDTATITYDVTCQLCPDPAGCG